jgi:hypothetical protein
MIVLSAVLYAIMHIVRIPFQAFLANMVDLWESQNSPPESKWFVTE